MSGEDRTHQMPTPVARATRRARDTAAETDELRAIRRAISLGLVIWPAFFLLDVVMCGVVHPEAKIERFAIYRSLGEAGIFLAWWLARGTSLRVVLAANAAMCIGAAILVSVMALSLGGLASPYLHGISVIVLVESAAIASHWRRSLLVVLPTALAYPAVMAVAAPFDPSLYASLTRPSDLWAFASHYVFVLASAFIATAVSHAVWRAKRELREARRLHRYRLDAPVGKGGMNEVWLAWDETLKRRLALKILRSAEPDAVTVSRFEQEAQATSQLTSPHTIRIHDFGASDDGVYFIAMEYLPGMDLRELVRRHGPLAPARAVHFAIQACRSLAEAHERGIVHRDVKPANLFVTRIDDDEDGLKVLDFGIARVRQPAASATLSHPGLTVGTPAYMAPETLVGSSADERSDIYSMGATLYDLLTGTPPFPAPTMQAVFVAHVSEAPEPPSLRRGEALPPRLEAIVLRCLEKQPSQRDTSVRALTEALEGCLDEPGWTVDDARAWWEAAPAQPVRSPAQQADRRP